MAAEIDIDIPLITRHVDDKDLELVEPWIVSVIIMSQYLNWPNKRYCDQALRLGIDNPPDSVVDQMRLAMPNDESLVYGIAKCELGINISKLFQSMTQYWEKMANLFPPEVLVERITEILNSVDYSGIGHTLDECQARMIVEEFVTKVVIQAEFLQACNEGTFTITGWNDGPTFSALAMA